MYDLRHSTRFDPFFSSFFFPLALRAPLPLIFNDDRSRLNAQVLSSRILINSSAHTMHTDALRWLSTRHFFPVCGFFSLSLSFSCLRLSLSTLIPANSIDNAKNFSRLYFRVRRSPTGSLNGGLHRISCLYVLPLLFHENSSSPPILVLMISRNRRAS